MPASCTGTTAAKKSWRHRQCHVNVINHVIIRPGSALYPEHEVERHRRHALFYAGQAGKSALANSMELRIMGHVMPCTPFFRVNGLPLICGEGGSGVGWGGGWL